MTTRGSILALVGGCLLALSGCAQDSRRTVTLWHQMRPADRAVLDAQIVEFEARHRDIRVRALYKETEELRSGMESAVLVGVGARVDLLSLGSARRVRRHRRASGHVAMVS